MESNRISAEYFPVPIDAIQSEGLGFDLYIVHERGTAVLYRSSGSSYSNTDCDQLREQGITHFYVPNTQHCLFLKAISDQMTSAYENPGLAQKERSRIVRDSCGKLIEDFTQNPNIPGLSDTLNAMAGKFSQWCGEDQSEFGYLLDMSEHDFYTTTHMVNVGVGCTLLAAEIFGAEHKMVSVISLGGLIHDIGKCGVSSEVLNKEGKLSDEEWAMIRSHPQVGADLLSAQDGLSRVTIDMTLNHHERLDGKGYPNGISADAISTPARICSVVDVYDALSSARPYRGPIAPRVVLDMMREDVGKAFDPKIFSAWECVIQRMLEADPARAVPETGTPPSITLDAMIPSPIAQTSTEIGVTTIYARGGRIYQSTGRLETINEIILDCDAKIDPGERVLLITEGGTEEVAEYVSARCGLKGQAQLVFKPLGSSINAA